MGRRDYSYGWNDQKTETGDKARTDGILALSTSGGNGLMELRRIVKKTREVLIELEETVVLSPDEHPVHEWCAQCGSNLPFITPSQASLILGVSVRTINRWVEAGAVHFIEKPNGSLLVCARSTGLDAGEH